MAEDAKVVPVSEEASTAAEVARVWQRPREVSLEEVADAIVRLSHARRRGRTRGVERCAGVARPHADRGRTRKVAARVAAPDLL